MSIRPVLFWFRQDLRIADNPGLSAALAHGGSVIPIYIQDESGEGDWVPGAASRWWLHHSLTSLNARLGQLGATLIVKKGPALKVLQEMVELSGAQAIYWNRRYEPSIIQRDSAIKSFFLQQGLEVHSFNGALILEPWEVQNKAGQPFKVFTPFWKTCLENLPQRFPVAPSPAENGSRWHKGPAREFAGLDVDALSLLPAIPWDAHFSDCWTPGEAGAAENLRIFVGRAFGAYKMQRDFPALPGTSRLSPHLHFGEVSPRQIWNFLAEVFHEDTGWIRSQYVAEIGWREFAHHLLYHFPDTTSRPLRPEFEAFPWREDSAGYRSWTRGLTGYPIVDAGMRELWATGWMHNRLRMIVASFLVKHLRISWSAGARWFWDTLVDADLASNTLGWQWAAGCGADAAPYFRIFNPILQGEKFDPDGVYVKKWVTELKKVPVQYIHKPWEMPAGVQKLAGVRIGVDYPEPVVDHAAARQSALAALQSIRKDGA
ncbi:MAG: DNA photolyase family protein [Verrucomicrobia bacterium]|nr:DNA photolyase family protein [Verrucomicrobiota bacterium]